MLRTLPRTVGRAACSGTARLSSSKPVDPLLLRAAYPHFERIQTRWTDNDAFGHINNAVYCARPAAVT
eukprot:1730865-Prymnesium_polylepis.1